MSAAAFAPPAPLATEVKHRGLITVAIMLATIMQVLDTTIANVALPSMTGDLGASQDTITWVLTSYIVASAIVTPMTGWLADRLGKRELFLISIVGFVATSLACGLAWSLPSMVMFRLMQGVFGAAIVPLSQTFLLDINPREKAGQAMAIWGAGIMVGPIIGPTLGGWLTESYNWRWVFLVNLPVGALALAGCLLYLPRAPRKERRHYLGRAHHTFVKRQAHQLHALGAGGALEAGRVAGLALGGGGRGRGARAQSPRRGGERLRSAGRCPALPSPQSRRQRLECPRHRAPRRPGAGERRDPPGL